MANKKQKPQQSSKRAMRNLRIQQMIFIGLGLIVIFSMILAMIAK